MAEMNDLESAIMKSLADAYPAFKSHLPFLQVRERQFTGVGAYVNFEYVSAPDLEDIPDGEYSAGEGIKIND